MKRILLVTDTNPAPQATRTMDQLREGIGSGFRLRELHVSGNASLLGRWGAIRRHAREVDLVHAWGARPLRLAVLGCDRPIIYTPLADDAPTTTTWLRAALSRKRIRVLSLSGGEDRLCIQMGIPAAACTLVPPGIHMPPTTGRDSALRQTLGISPEQKVVLAVGDSYPHANHRASMHATAILTFMDARFCFLFTGRGPEAQSVERLHETFRTGSFVNASRILERPITFEELIRAADVGLVSAPGRLDVSPVLACMARGLPLVAPATRPVSEILEDRHTALLYSPMTPRMTAQRTLMMFEQPGLARRLADQARAEAYELFGLSRFVGDVRRIYDEIV